MQGPRQSCNDVENSRHWFRNLSLFRKSITIVPPILLNNFSCMGIFGLLCKVDEVDFYIEQHQRLLSIFPVQNQHSHLYILLRFYIRLVLKQFSFRIFGLHWPYILPQSLVDFIRLSKSGLPVRGPRLAIVIRLEGYQLDLKDFWNYKDI